jgi:hypothetical protein
MWGMILRVVMEQLVPVVSAVVVERVKRWVGKWLRRRLASATEDAPRSDPK